MLVRRGSGALEQQVTYEDRAGCYFPKPIWNSLFGRHFFAFTIHSYSNNREFSVSFHENATNHLQSMDDDVPAQNSGAPLGMMTRGIPGPSKNGSGLSMALNALKRFKVELS